MAHVERGDALNRPVPTAAQQIAARVAGAMYVLTMATAVFSEIFVRGRLVVPGDPTATARNIVASEFLFRLGVLGGVLTVAGVAVLVWGLFTALRPAAPQWATLGAFLRLAEVSMAATLIVHSFGVLRLVGTAPYLSAFEPVQLHVLARVLLGMDASGTYIVFVLLGLGSAAFAWGWLQSGYVHRWVALWGIGSSLLLAVGSMAVVVFPGLMSIGISYMIPLGVFEVGFGAWLALRGLPGGDRSRNAGGCAAKSGRGEVPAG